MKTATRFTGGTVATIGGVILTLIPLRADAHLELPHWAVVSAYLVGVLFALCGVLIFVFGGLGSAWQLFNSRMKGDNSPHFECQPAKESDLKALRLFYESYFGSDVPSLLTMKLWHRRNPYTFWILYDVSRSSLHRLTRILKGSFKILTIHADYLYLLDQELVKGTDVPEAAIVPLKDAAALYVGDVAASGATAKAALLAYLDSRAEGARKRGLPIYARPLTSDGLRLIRGHGFEPVSGAELENPIGHIFRLDADRSLSSAPLRGKRLAHRLLDP